MDFKNVSTSAIQLQMLSVYGDGKYLSTKEYQNVHNEMVSELMTRILNKK